MPKLHEWRFSNFEVELVEEIVPHVCVNTVGPPWGSSAVFVLFVEAVDVGTVPFDTTCSVPVPPDWSMATEDQDPPSWRWQCWLTRR